MRCERSLATSVITIIRPSLCQIAVQNNQKKSQSQDTEGCSSSFSSTRSHQGLDTLLHLNIPTANRRIRYAMVNGPATLGQRFKAPIVVRQILPACPHSRFSLNTSCQVYPPYFFLDLACSAESIDFLRRYSADLHSSLCSTVRSDVPISSHFQPLDFVSVGETSKAHRTTSVWRSRIDMASSHLRSWPPTAPAPPPVVAPAIRPIPAPTGIDRPKVKIAGTCGFLWFVLVCYVVWHCLMLFYGFFFNGFFDGPIDPTGISEALATPTTPPAKAPQIPPAVEPTVPPRTAMVEETPTRVLVLKL